MKFSPVLLPHNPQYPNQATLKRIKKNYNQNQLTYTSRAVQRKFHHAYMDC